MEIPKHIITTGQNIIVLLRAVVAVEEMSWVGFQLESSPIYLYTTNSKHSKHPRDVNVDWPWRAYFRERAWNSPERDLSANSVESIQNIKLALAYVDT